MNRQSDNNNNKHIKTINEIILNGQLKIPTKQMAHRI